MMAADILLTSHRPVFLILQASYLDTVLPMHKIQETLAGAVLILSMLTESHAAHCQQMVGGCWSLESHQQGTCCAWDDFCGNVDLR